MLELFDGVLPEVVVDLCSSIPSFVAAAMDMPFSTATRFLP